MSDLTVDAVVIGAGHNGLVAANLLADAGWDVAVLEEQPEPGGAVRSGELIEPGFRNDLFSAFYPLAAASPVIRGLELERHGLRWVRAPEVLAHPTPDGRCAVLSTDLDTTARSLDDYAAGDGDAWRRLFEVWQRVDPHRVEAIVRPFPPVLPAARMGARLGPAGALRFARQGALSARRMGQEEFTGEGGRLLLTGNALHADLTPESAGSGLYGWLLACLGQQHGFPVPRGGAGRLVDALLQRLGARGRLHCGDRVARVVVEGGRAIGVETAAGLRVRARRAVLADVGAPALYLDLVGRDHLPPRLLDDLRRFEYDAGAFKVDWTLDGPVPWKSVEARRAGTVHIADDVDDLSRYATDLATSTLPAHPFLLVGQMTTTDPSRSPAGTETLWAYTHVPRTIRSDGGGGITGWVGGGAERFAERIEERIEAYAPGFRDLIRGRHVFTPDGLHARNANLVDGAVNGGTAQLHQQLVFRPVPGLARPETVVGGLYLASASAHPGGGVHGAPGANAARAALGSDRRRRRLVAVGAGLAGGALAGVTRRGR
jgi:phytoene dehydrogenase-like protein